MRARPVVEGNVTAMKSTSSTIPTHYPPWLAAAGAISLTVATSLGVGDSGTHFANDLAVVVVAGGVGEHVAGAFALVIDGECRRRTEVISER
jgi:hypothetical protein